MIVNKNDILKYISFIIGLLINMNTEVLKVGSASPRGPRPEFWGSAIVQPNIGGAWTFQEKIFKKYQI